ncbi:hypothetical protein [Peribacillus kribbensis]|uniref:hypothetical protein n=1 Tax=Peribacillus kribbensis TaxID=356658 RepID=UPI0003FD7C89|nr:hypothetical protein [Peribacillus kribbensis]
MHWAYEIANRLIEKYPAHKVFTCASKKMRKRKKQLFRHIYQLTTGRNQGPRVPLLIRVAGRERLLHLLDL